MASANDRKISQLPVASATEDTTNFIVVSGISTTPVNERITTQTLFNNVPVSLVVGQEFAGKNVIFNATDDPTHRFTFTHETGDVDMGSNASIAKNLNIGGNLVVDGIGSYDSFSWWYDDKTGGGYSNTGVTTSPYSPSLPGKYKVIAQKQCGTDPIQQFESKEVTVSVCPTDFDSDGVADNIDLDVDNDGIFNSTESLGVVSFDLLDIINHIMNLILNSFWMVGN